jgi:hypothetical protein
MPSVLIVNSPGPQGAVGPQGPAGPTGSFDTGSLVTTGSFNAFTGSYNTGSFTGSFTGDGTNLYNIQASGITGLNLSQIASGSVTASISPSDGFRINTNTTITGSLRIQPTSSATQVVAIIQAGSGSLALIPSGIGAIIAAIPDGTATGGNARGAGAVDLQMNRSAADQVAGPYNVIMGYRNKGGGTFSIAMGESCVSNDTATVAMGSGTTAGAQYAVAFGRSNYTNGQQSTISGGQSNQIIGSNYSTISGGQSNTASTNSHATVVGGQGNTSSGQYSISGGTSNTAGGSRSIALGDSNNASAYGAVCIGLANTGTGQYSFAIGFRSTSYLESQFSLASDRFSAAGDAQQSLLTARREATLTTATTAVLSLDGTGTSKLIIPNGNNRAWHTTVDTVATVTTVTGTATGVTVGDSFMQTDKLLFKKIGGTSSVVGRSTTETIYDTSMSTALMSFTAGASQELAITFTAPTFAGGGSITCRVVSKVSLVEVAY